MNKPAFIAAIAAVILTGCSRTTEDAGLERAGPVTPPATGQVDTGTATGSAAAPVVGDVRPMGQASTIEAEREALGVLNVINENEIALGAQALEKRVTGAVASYAQAMIDAHTENRDLTSTMDPLATAPRAVEERAEGEAKLAELARHEGDAYAAAYIEAMVEGHTDALAALDTRLIPAATTEQVAAHLRQTRAHVAQHLADAQRLQNQAR